jgi:hypothetical protein
MHSRSSVTGLPGLPGLVLVATAAVALSACSFDSPTSSSSQLTGHGVDTIQTVAGYTGTFAYLSSGSQYGFTGSTEVTVGDLPNTDQTNRGILTFDVQPLDGDTAQEAVLTAYECDVIGAPFSTLGQVVVDHVTPGTPPSGQGGYSGNIIASDIGTLAPDDATGPRNVSVTSAVESDISSGATYSQFRLRFSAEDGNPNGTANYVAFETDYQVNCAADASLSPVLIVTY